MSSPTRNVAFGPLFAEVFKEHLFTLVRSKKLIILSIVMFLPAIGALIYLVQGGQGGFALYKNLVEYVVMVFLLPLIGLYFGGPAIVDEVEGRTITYLFLRPVTKQAIFLGKVAASSLCVALLVVVPLTVFFFIASSAGSSPGDHMQLFAQTLVSSLVGSVAYTAIFAALGAVFARSLLSGILFWAIVEWGLSFVPVLEVLAVKYHMRNTSSLIDPNHLGKLDGLVLKEPIHIPIWGSYAYMIGLVVLVSFCGILIFREKEYKV